MILSIFSLPHSSDGKESAWNPGDPGSIARSGISTREGIGCPLQSSWAYLVTQLVKNPPAVRETWVQSLGWEDPLEKGKATHSSIHGLLRSDCKESVCSEGDLGSIPGLGRCPGGWHGNPVQYSWLENSHDRAAWRATVHGVAKSWT